MAAQNSTSVEGCSAISSAHTSNSRPKSASPRRYQELCPGNKSEYQALRKNLNREDSSDNESVIDGAVLDIEELLNLKDRDENWHHNSNSDKGQEGIPEIFSDILNPQKQTPFQTGTRQEGFSQEEEEKGLNEMKIELDEVSNGWLTTENADRRKIKVENQETLSIGDLSLGAQYFEWQKAIGLRVLNSVVARQISIEDPAMGTSMESARSNSTESRLKRSENSNHRLRRPIRLKPLHCYRTND